MAEYLKTSDGKQDDLHLLSELESFEILADDESSDQSDIKLKSVRTDTAAELDTIDEKVKLRNIDNSKSSLLVEGDTCSNSNICAKAELQLINTGCDLDESLCTSYVVVHEVNANKACYSKGNSNSQDCDDGNEEVHLYNPSHSEGSFDMSESQALNDIGHHSAGISNVVVHEDTACKAGDSQGSNSQDYDNCKKQIHLHDFRHTVNLGTSTPKNNTNEKTQSQIMNAQYEQSSSTSNMIHEDIIKKACNSKENSITRDCSNSNEKMPFPHYSCQIEGSFDGPELNDRDDQSSGTLNTLVHEDDAEKACNNKDNLNSQDCGNSSEETHLYKCVLKSSCNPKGSFDVPESQVLNVRDYESRVLNDTRENDTSKDNINEKAQSQIMNAEYDQISSTSNVIHEDIIKKACNSKDNSISQDYSNSNENIPFPHYSCEVEGSFQGPEVNDKNGQSSGTLNILVHEDTAEKACNNKDNLNLQDCGNSSEETHLYKCVPKSSCNPKGSFDVPESQVRNVRDYEPGVLNDTRENDISKDSSNEKAQSQIVNAEYDQPSSASNVIHEDIIKKACNSKDNSISQDCSNSNENIPFPHYSCEVEGSFHGPEVNDKDGQSSGTLNILVHEDTAENACNNKDNRNSQDCGNSNEETHLYNSCNPKGSFDVSESQVLNNRVGESEVLNPRDDTSQVLNDRDHESVSTSNVVIHKDTATKVCDSQHLNSQDTDNDNDVNPVNPVASTSNVTENTADTYNILLLGETGVGKSTFLNAFMNYIHFSTLEEALQEEETLSLIPSRFTMTDRDYNIHDVRIGAPNTNESLILGQPFTKSCKGYKFTFGNISIRFIDTPGAVDSGSLAKDDENLVNLIDYLQDVDYINAILILLKPNESKLTALFHYCVKRLLSCLEKSATQNIIFLFTNSRGTFYRPGDVVQPLKIILDEIASSPPHIRVPFSSQNSFCVDSEAFRYLAAIRQGCVFEDDLKQTIVESWEKSANTCERLLMYITKLEKHVIKNSVSIMEVRKTIEKLRWPLGRTVQHIEENLKLIEGLKHNMSRTDDKISELAQNLLFTRQKLRIVRLDEPRTVCRHPSCVTYGIIEDSHIQTYETICHQPCTLKKVVQERIGDEQLQNCWAMLNGMCRRCTHSYLEHKHIYYDVQTYIDTIIDPKIEADVLTKESAREVIEKGLKELTEDQETFKKEKITILKAMAKFAHFLNTCAILPYNDAFEMYVKLLIKNEMQKGDFARQSIIDNYKMLIKGYKEEINILKEDLEQLKMQGHSVDSVVTVSEVLQIVEELYGLSFTGKYIKDMYDAAQDCMTMTQSHHDDIIEVRPLKKSSSTQKVRFAWLYKVAREIKKLVINDVVMGVEASMHMS